MYYLNEFIILFIQQQSQIFFLGVIIVQQVKIKKIVFVLCMCPPVYTTFGLYRESDWLPVKEQGFNAFNKKYMQITI